MGRRQRLVVTDIPSDSEPESIDGLCQSSDDEVLRSSEGQSFDDEEEEEEESEEDEIEEDTTEKWKAVKKARHDTPFSENVGPNLPENIRTPLEIFLSLFSSDLLDSK